MNNISDDKSYNEAIEIAHLRFAVIAPVIQGVFAEPTKTAYYKRVAQNAFKMPDGRNVFFNYNTFEKWEASYKHKGMDGLMPKSRRDAGVSRSLSAEAIDEIYRLLQQFPKINATLIYTKLIEDGFIKASKISVCSVQRFIKNNNLKYKACVTKDM